METASNRLYLPVLAILCAVCFVPFSPELPATGLDPSWEWGLNEAVARHLVFGRDLIFTFGPFGFVYTRLFHPATDVVMLLAWALIGCGVLAALAVLSTRRNLLYVAAFPLLAAAFDIPDALFFYLPILYLLATVRIANEATPLHLGNVPLVLMAGTLALLPLIKGTLGVVALAGIAFMSIVVARRSLAQAAMLPVAFSVALPIAWWSVGQPLSGIMAYFGSMSEIVAGYTTAMSSSGKPLRVVAFAIFAPLAISIVYRRNASTDSTARVCIGLLSLGCAFIAFKAAFVRHDYIHVQTATGFLLLLGWQCVAIDPPRRAAWWLGVFALAWVLSSRQPLQALAYPVRTVANNVQGIWIRSTYSNLLEDKYAERIRELRAARPLPKLAGRTDIFPVDHADIIANDLEWGPRPVFQSYSAYTPALAAKNAAYLSGPNSPDNIFFGIAAIDGRFPALDDGPSWPILLTRYAAVQEVGDYVLLRKRETSLASEYGELLLDRQAAVGERVVIPATGAILLAEVEWQPSLLGKLAATAFKLPTPRIAVELADGAVRDYRFVPSVSDAGFVLSPLVETPEAFVGLAGSGVAPPVTGVRFHCDQSALCFLWESSLTVRVRELTIAR